MPEPKKPRSNPYLQYLEAQIAYSNALQEFNSIMGLARGDTDPKGNWDPMAPLDLTHEGKLDPSMAYDAMRNGAITPEQYNRLMELNARMPGMQNQIAVLKPYAEQYIKEADASYRPVDLNGLDPDEARKVHVAYRRARERFLNSTDPVEDIEADLERQLAPIFSGIEGSRSRNERRLDRQLDIAEGNLRARNAELDWRSKSDIMQDATQRRGQDMSYDASLRRIGVDAGSSILTSIAALLKYSSPPGGLDLRGLATRMGIPDAERFFVAPQVISPQQVMRDAFNEFTGARVAGSPAAGSAPAPVTPNVAGSRSPVAGAVAAGFEAATGTPPSHQGELLGWASAVIAAAHQGLTVDRNYFNLCLQFVDDTLGLADRSGRSTALEVWQNSPNKQTDLSKLKPGDVIYGTGANPAGHVAIYIGNGKVIGHQRKDGNGIAVATLEEFRQFSGGTILGFEPLESYAGRASRVPAEAAAAGANQTARAGAAIARAAQQQSGQPWNPAASETANVTAEPARQAIAPKATETTVAEPAPAPAPEAPPALEPAPEPAPVPEDPWVAAAAEFAGEKPADLSVSDKPFRDWQRSDSLSSGPAIFEALPKLLSWLGEWRENSRSIDPFAEQKAYMAAQQALADARAAERRAATQPEREARAAREAERQMAQAAREAERQAARDARREAERIAQAEREAQRIAQEEQKALEAQQRAEAFEALKAERLAAANAAWEKSQAERAARMQPQLEAQRIAQERRALAEQQMAEQVAARNAEREAQRERSRQLMLPENRAALEAERERLAREQSAELRRSVGELWNQGMELAGRFSLPGAVWTWIQQQAANAANNPLDSFAQQMPRPMSLPTPAPQPMALPVPAVTRLPAPQPVALPTPAMAPAIPMNPAASLSEADYAEWLRSQLMGL
jgi:hypothetical protein